MLCLKIELALIFEFFFLSHKVFSPGEEYQLRLEHGESNKLQFTRKTNH